MVRFMVKSFLMLTKKTYGKGEKKKIDGQKKREIDTQEED